MTTAVQATTSPRRPPATEPVIDLLVELAGDLPPAERHARLLHHLRRLFPCDAAALLRLEDGVLYPVAVEGLSEDTLGRRFPLAEHPRLARLVAAEGPVRFDADGLPDPYDGLVDASPEEFEVHDCMGAALRLNGRVWGVMTLDALRPGAFDGVDPAGFAEFTRLAAASVGAAEAMVRLSREVQQERDHRHVVEREPRRASSSATARRCRN
jgi:anaerobic nitric oxide reductase transcription regulator